MPASALLRVAARPSLDTGGGSIYVNLLPVDIITLPEDIRLPGLWLLCGRGKRGDVLPSGEFVPHLLTVMWGREPMASGPEVLHNRTIGGEETLGLPW